MSVSPANETTRRGNNVLHSYLPISLRHCPSQPSATACDRHQWDLALPHCPRKQKTHCSSCTWSARTMRLRVFFQHQNLDLTMQQQGKYVPAACKTQQQSAGLVWPAILATWINPCKQQTDTTWMHIMEENQKTPWANRVFYAPPCTKETRRGAVSL